MKKILHPKTLHKGVLRRKATGLCVSCGKRPPMTGLQNCGHCREAMLARRNRLIAKGLCPDCGVRARYASCLDCSECRDRRNKKSKEVRQQIRAHVFAKFGNKCACCGEAAPEFLQIDHINNDGAKHRRSVEAGITLCRWLIKSNFPPGFQLLCANCNFAKGMYGVCPHEKARRMVCEEIPL